MELEYRVECQECNDIWGSACHGHDIPVLAVPVPQELCNNCGQYAPASEINFAGFCSACQLVD